MEGLVPGPANRRKRRAQELKQSEQALVRDGDKHWSGMETSRGGANAWIGPRRLGLQPRATESAELKGREEAGSKTRQSRDGAWPAPRPAPSLLSLGILFSNGPRWWTLRNFALGALKEFGLGTRTIEERILEEAACLLGKFQATIGAAWERRGAFCGCGQRSRRGRAGRLASSVSRASDCPSGL